MKLVILSSSQKWSNYSTAVQHCEWKWSCGASSFLSRNCQYFIHYIFVFLITFDEMDGEQLNRKLQSAVDTMLQSVDANKMRPMQKKTYLAMAACFDNKSASSQQIESCLNSSSHSVKVSQQIIQQEMNQFQSRLQRCAADCEDSVRDRNPNMNDQASVDKMQGQMVTCMSSCVGESSFHMLARLHFCIDKLQATFFKAYSSHIHSVRKTHCSS